MNKVVLVFADLPLMAEFISTHNISNAEACSAEQSLIGTMDEEDIITAVRDFGGRVRTLIQYES